MDSTISTAWRPTVAGAATCQICGAVSSGASRSTRTSRARRFRNSERDESRLLVAASPNDEVADTHWLRADVDQHLALAAAAAGAELLEETEVTDVALRTERAFASSCATEAARRDRSTSRT